MKNALTEIHGPICLSVTAAIAVCLLVSGTVQPGRAQSAVGASMTDRPDSRRASGTLQPGRPKHSYDRITYGQFTVGPAEFRGINLLDWYGEGRNVMLTATGHLYRNTGGAQPIWEPDPRNHKLLTAAFKEVRPFSFFTVIRSVWNGRPEVVAFEGNEGSQGRMDPKPAALYVWRNTGSPEKPAWRRIRAKTPEGAPYLSMGTSMPGTTLTSVDWTGDGKDDLIIGENHIRRVLFGFLGRPAADYLFKEDGYAPADQESQATAPRLYLLRNLSTEEDVVFGPPEVLKVGERELESYAIAYPAAFRLPGDRAPKLIVGDHNHRSGLRLYEKSPANDTQLVPLGRIRDEANQLFSTFTKVSPVVGDVDGDGVIDLVTSGYYGFGPHYWHRATYSPREKNLQNWKWQEMGWISQKVTPDTPIPRFVCTTVEPVDWTGSGVRDLLLGAEPGTPWLMRNRGSNVAPIFEPPERLKFIDGSLLETHASEIGDGSRWGPLEHNNDRSTPRVVDWDGDGILDIVSGSMGRRIYWMRGQMRDGELRFEKPQVFSLEGKILVHPHRVLVDVLDWNGDGKLDVVGVELDAEYTYPVTVYFGNGTSDFKGKERLLTTTGAPISVMGRFQQRFGGRAGIKVCDWDGDGHNDLLVHSFSTGVFWYRSDAHGRFEPARELFSHRNHLSGPSVVDWDGDGIPDILLGETSSLGGLKGTAPPPGPSSPGVIYGENTAWPPGIRKLK